ncbi:MAG: Kelch repeat-containing protein, partial [Planctomycetota bacterium]
NPNPANIAGTETDHLMLHMTVSADATEDVTLSEARLRNTGATGAPTNVASASLIRDDNGNGSWDGTPTDTILGTVNNPSTDTFIFLFAGGETITASTTASWLLLFTFTGNATIGDNFQASLTQGVDLIATGDTTTMSVPTTGAPVPGGLQTIPPGTLSVSAGPAMPPGASVTPPVVQSVLQISLTAGPTEAVNVSSVAFTDSGGGAPANVQWVHLLDDTGPTPGQFDPGAGGDGILLMNANFSGSTVTFSISANIPAGQTVNWILVYDWAAGTGAYRATINPATQIVATGVVSSTTITASGSPVQGNVFTLSGGPAGMNWGPITSAGGPGQRIYLSGVYDTGNQRMLFFGGSNTTTIIGGGTNTVHALNTATVGTESWTLLAPGGTGPPTARYSHGAVFDATGQRMLVFGGIDNTLTTRTDVWALSTSGGGNGNWSQVSTTGSAPARGNAAVAFDPGTNSLLVVGGADALGNEYGDTHQLDLTTGQWTQRSTGGPSARSGCIGAVNAGVMMVFGGYTNATTTYHQDTWILNISTWGWTQVFPGVVPPIRAEMGFALDPVNGRVYIYGGTDMNGVLNDVYYFDFGVQNWVQISPGGSPPNARQACGAAWDTTNLRMIIHGGGVVAMSSTLYGDTHELR